MKKITFLLMTLLSFTAFSQIEIVENFNNTANNQIPPNWTSTGFGANTLVGCGGTGLGVFASVNAGTNKTLTTPNYTAISNGTNLTASFSYNVFAAAGPGNFAAPPSGWGTIDLEYSTDGGATWTNITTIDDSVFTFVSNTDCGASGTISVGVIANASDFQARFVANNTAAGTLIYAIDNVSIVQTPTTVPNCNATLISPANGSSTANPSVTLTWQAATGFATGYTVSVGTTSGGTEIVNAQTTTETSYAISGLDYETDYFVNIVPFNSFGDATGCTEESFTTRSEPIAGASCDTAFDVTFTSSLYLSSSDTALYEDAYDASPCSNSYLSGKDVFYRIAPTTDMSINIDLVNISNNGASIHVVEGCVDVATECIAYVGSFSTDNRTLTDVVLTAGNTYYVVLSNSSNTRTYTYDMIITQNSCVSPAMELTPVEDCGNGQYSIDVDVTYLGSATSLTLTDGVNTISNITTTGVVNIGPYTSGSTTTLTLINDQDGACDFETSTYYFCPPSNDECTDAVALTVNTDGSCTVVTSATNAGATQSTTDPSSCAATNRNDVWFSFVATDSSLILEYLNVTDAIDGGASIMATELLEGTCDGGLTSIDCTASLSGYITLNGLTVNNTYYIRNFTNNASVQYAQNFDICLKTLPAAPSNDECTNAAVLTASTADSCDNQVAGSTLGATLSAESTCTGSFGDVWYIFNPTTSGTYRFSLENLGSTQTYYSVYKGSCGSLSNVSVSCSSNAEQIYGLDSAETYYVLVRSNQTGPGVDFNICVSPIPTAAANNDCVSATTLLESADSTGNNSISGNLDNAYNSPESCGSSSTEAIWYSFTPTYTGTYFFDFTRVSGSASYTVFNTDNCADTIETGYIPGFTSCFNSTDKTGDLVAGNTYLISVHASSAAAFDLFVYPDPALNVGDNVFDLFKFYPNPVKSNLTVEAGAPISNISMFNMMGQQVMVTRPNTMSSTLDMSGLNDGVYFVTVTIDNAQKTIKVIKN